MTGGSFPALDLSPSDPLGSGHWGANALAVDKGGVAAAAAVTAAARALIGCNTGG